jgi:hypothetical protein
MKRVEFFCDHCRQQVEKEANLFQIKLSIMGMPIYSYSQHATKEMKEEWCRPCCERAGFLPANSGKVKQEEVKERTISDLIEEMVEASVEQAVCNR